MERTFHYVNISVDIPAEIKAAGFTESYIEVLRETLSVSLARLQSGVCLLFHTSSQSSSYPVTPFQSAGRLWFQQHCIEILIVAQLVNKFETLCGKNRILSAAHCLIFSQVKWLYSTILALSPPPQKKHFFNMFMYIFTSREQWSQAVWGVGLRPLACWDCGFESCRGHRCLSVVSVGCCQVEVSAIGWSVVQRSPTDCGVSECDRGAQIMRRSWSTGGGAAPSKKDFHNSNVPYLICRLILLK